MDIYDYFKFREELYQKIANYLGDHNYTNGEFVILNDCNDGGGNIKVFFSDSDEVKNVNIPIKVLEKY